MKGDIRLIEHPGTPPVHDDGVCVCVCVCVLD